MRIRIMGMMMDGFGDYTYGFRGIIILKSIFLMKAVELGSCDVFFCQISTMQFYLGI